MKYLGYILSIVFLRLLSVLPRPILYFLSDLLYILLYYVAGYRRKTAWNNISSAFPEMKKSEVRKTVHRFYRHLADLFLEFAVILYYPKKKLEYMFRMKNPELIEKYYDEGRHVILVTGHYNNWEWALPLSYTFRHTLLAVYKPLKNQYFENTFRKMRGRFGAEVVPMKQIGRTLFRCNDQGILTLTGMVADQRPARRNIHFWTRFLHHDTPVFLGSEKLAVKFNAVVVYMKVRKEKRGVYQAEFELVTDSPKEEEPYVITKKHTAILEDLIREDPARWLWTHKRWKISYGEWKQETEHH